MVFYETDYLIFGILGKFEDFPIYSGGTKSGAIIQTFNPFPAHPLAYAKVFCR